MDSGSWNRDLCGRVGAKTAATGEAQQHARRGGVAASSEWRTGGVAESRTVVGRPAREQTEPATVADTPRGAEAMRGTTSRVRDDAAYTHGRRVFRAAATPSSVGRAVVW
uniref:Uncharacterized protein n=1 Tax=Oryza meridionalis TaxID=40149 RepID=A0A0E0CD98_9ORYZ